MHFPRMLFAYLFSFPFASFALAHEADQIVLGDMRPFKLFEPSPTPELSPIATEGTRTRSQDDMLSSPQITIASGSSGSGGGANCVQGCLARAASQVGCGGSANFWCVCKKGAYVGKAWDCFGQSGCPGSDIGQALGDLNVACRPYRQFSPDDESPQSPMVIPERTPVTVPFESRKLDEL